MKLRNAMSYMRRSDSILRLGSGCYAISTDRDVTQSTKLFFAGDKIYIRTWDKDISSVHAFGSPFTLLEGSERLSIYHAQDVIRKIKKLPNIDKEVLSHFMFRRISAQECSHLVIENKYKIPVYTDSTRLVVSYDYRYSSSSGFVAVIPYNPLLTISTWYPHIKDEVVPKWETESGIEEVFKSCKGKRLVTCFTNDSVFPAMASHLMECFESITELKRQLLHIRDRIQYCVASSGLGQMTLNSPVRIINMRYVTDAIVAEESEEVINV